MLEGSLSSILKEGRSIDVMFNGKRTVTDLTVIKVYESMIDLGVENEESHLDEFLAVGDSASCCFDIEDGLYFIEGWISRVKVDSPQRITIQAHKVQKKKNLSMENSYDVFIGTIIRMEQNDKGIFTITKKISSDSLVVALKDGIDIDKKMHLELLLPQNIIFRCVAEGGNSSKDTSKKEIEVKINEPDILNKRIYENFIADLKKAGPEEYNKRDSFWKRNSKAKY